MQAKAPRLRRASSREEELVLSFLRSLGVEWRPNSNLYVLEVPGAHHHDVFDVAARAEDILRRLRSAYSSGYYLGSIMGKEFVPGLPLAQRLSKLCDISIRCLELDEWGSKVFLYGKDVNEEHIVRFAEGLRVVLDPLGEALGWGTGSYTTLKNKQTKIVSPVKDLGWYLRRGG